MTKTAAAKPALASQLVAINALLATRVVSPERRFEIASAVAFAPTRLKAAQIVRSLECSPVDLCVA